MFDCQYRNLDDGSCSWREINALSRKEAFAIAAAENLHVIRMVERNQKPSKPSKVICQSKHAPVSEVIRQSKPVSVSEDVLIFRQREHSYAIGFLFSIFGLALSIILWKERGAKYALYGVLFGAVAGILMYLFGTAGFVLGVVAALIFDYKMIPRPNQKTNWDEL